MNIRIIKTNGRDPTFKSLTALLDEHLESLNGKQLQQDRYASFNTTDNIENAYIIYVGEFPVGCGAYKYYDQKNAELKRIFVKSEYRRMHLASTLIERIELDAYDEGFEYMLLESATLLKGAHQLYESIGYHKIPNFPPFEDFDTSYCFLKEL